MQRKRASYQAIPLSIRTDTHALQHPIHLFGLPQNPLQHRRPVAEIAHGVPLCQGMLGRSGQLRLTWIKRQLRQIISVVAIAGGVRGADMRAVGPAVHRI